MTNPTIGDKVWSRLKNHLEDVFFDGVSRCFQMQGVASYEFVIDYVHYMLFWTRNVDFWTVCPAFTIVLVVVRGIEVLASIAVAFFIPGCELQFVERLLGGSSQDLSS